MNQPLLSSNISFAASLVAQTVKRLPAIRETWVRSLGREDSPGEGNGNPLQYSCLENPMDGGAWWATVHGVTKSRTRLSDFPPSLPPSLPPSRTSTLHSVGQVSTELKKFKVCSKLCPVITSKQARPEMAAHILLGGHTNKSEFQPRDTSPP